MRNPSRIPMYYSDSTVSPSALMDNVMTMVEVPPEPVFDTPQPDSLDSGHTLEELAEMINIAEILDEVQLNTIGATVVEEYQADKASREGWEAMTAGILRLAEMEPEQLTRDYPFQNASNVVHVLTARAAVQFAARAESVLLTEPLLKAKPTGADPQGRKAARAQREADYLNYQLVEEMEFPAQERERFGHSYLVGDSYAKTYWDNENRRPCVEFVEASELVMNYYGPGVKQARRKTHHYWLYRDEIVALIRNGSFRDTELGLGEVIRRGDLKGEEEENEANQYDTGYLILEQHRYLDLDNDGYGEPYIVFVENASGKVLRIKARFTPDGVVRDGQNRVLRIKAYEYFDGFPTLCSMRKRAYGLGVGALLYFHNHAINTLINQIIDAGTLNNSTGGFYKRGAVNFSGPNNPDGTIEVDTNKWTPLDFEGDDINKVLYQFKFDTNNQVMFALLGMLVESGNELASSTEILSGSQPHAQMPATSLLALIEQGQQLFSSILKSYHRTYKSIYKKIQELNQRYGQPAFAEAEADPAYYYGDGKALLPGDLDRDGLIDVVPESDPKNVTDFQKLTRGQALESFIGRGYNDKEIDRRRMASIGEPDIDKIIPPDDVPAPPPPEALIEMEKLRQSNDKLQGDLAEKEAQIQKVLAEADKVRAETELALQSLQDQTLRQELEQLKKDNEQLLALARLALERVSNNGEDADNPGAEPGRPQQGGVLPLAEPSGDGAVLPAGAGAVAGEAGAPGQGGVPLAGQFGPDPGAEFRGGGVL